MASPHEMLLESRRYLEARDYSAAAEVLEEVAFGRPDDEALEAARSLALVRRVQGRYRDELRAARRVCELVAGTEREGGDRLRLAEVLVRTGRLSDAEDVLRDTPAAQAADPCLFHIVQGLILGRSRGDPAGAVREFRQATELPSAPPGLRASARACLGHALARTGRIREAERALREALDELPHASDLGARLTRGHVLLSLAEVFLEIGDLPSARRSCEEALAEAEVLRSAGIRRWYHLRASLIAAASGDVRGAIRLILSPDHFKAIAEIGERRLAFYAFANAAMFAIELGEISAAEAYLQRSEGLARDARTEQEPAYLLLLQGALRVARREFEAAERHLDRAEAAFAGMTEGGYRRGLCEVLLRRGELCRARRDIPGALRVAMRAVEIAERDGFIDVQSRALLLKSFLLVDESKGLDDVYDDVIQRMHIVNSPAVMFKILSNLYFYSQKFGCYDIEAFHWQRLQNMRSILEDSVYRDLYSEYVAKRYAKKIADMLAGPRPGESAPREAEPELPDPRELDAMF